MCGVASVELACCFASLDLLFVLLGWPPLQLLEALSHASPGRVMQLT